MSDFERKLRELKEASKLPPDVLTRQQERFEAYMLRINRIILPTLESIKASFIEGPSYIRAQYNPNIPLSYENYPREITLVWNPYKEHGSLFNDCLGVIDTPDRGPLNGPSEKLTSEGMSVSGPYSPHGSLYKHFDNIYTIEDLQEKALRLITNKHTHSHTPLSFKDNNILYSWNPLYRPL